MSSTPAFFSAVSGSRVDREKRIISGVSVVTSGIEARGHRVFTDQKTLQTVMACASAFSEGVRVKANHGTGVDSIIGTLKNFRIEGEKLLGDLHLLESHDLTIRVLELAEEMPSIVGLSISFSQTNENIGGKDFARCEDLFSVDLVDRPAANPSGLFARVDSPPNDMAELSAQEKSFVDHIRAFFGANQPAPVNFEAKSKELETQLSAKATEFAALQSKVTELEAAKLKIEGDLKAALEKQTDFDAKVEKAAAEKAAAINANLGVPPATTKPDGGTKLDFSALVAAKVSGGMTKAQATAFCVQNHPSEYAEWRKNGKTQTL